MPDIVPFGLNPLAGLDRLTCYWFATMVRLVYHRDDELSLACVQVAGGFAVERITPSDALAPSMLLARFPNNAAAVVCEGTTNVQQWILHSVGVAQQPLAPWPGTVNTFFAFAAARAWATLLPRMMTHSIQNLVTAGHSFGASIGILLQGFATGPPLIGSAGVCTFGAPRVGNVAFAAAQNYPHVRLTNAQDPIPLLPGSFNNALDHVLSLNVPVNLLAYRHSGTRFHLFHDGSAAQPTEQATWNEAVVYLENQLRTSDGFIGAHEPSEYARRLRAGIPVEFGVESEDWPGLLQLDQINAALNGVPVWNFLEPVC